MCLLAPIAISLHCQWDAGPAQHLALGSIGVKLIIILILKAGYLRFLISSAHIYGKLNEDMLQNYILTTALLQ